jgi:hypothetical protein
MPYTQFNPKLNGIQGTISEHLMGIGPRKYETILRQSRRSVLESMRAKYYGAVDIYNLDDHLERWSETGEAIKIGREAGLLYLLLDCFHAQIFPPETLDKSDGLRSAEFSSYFWRRSAENLEANTARLLTALAVAILLPDEWFPQVTLERRIQAEIDRLRVFEKVQITADLGLPPAGLGWMGDTTRTALEAVQTKLKSGKPCLVRMIRDPQRLNANRQVIVYEASPMSGSGVRLSIYEPGCVCSEHTIEADLSGEKPSLVETCVSGEPEPIFGLLSEYYAPADLPKACIAPWMRIRWTRSWYWQFRHALHQIRF